MDQCYYLEKESTLLEKKKKNQTQTNIRTLSSPNPVLYYTNTIATVVDKTIPVLVLV